MNLEGHRRRARVSGGELAFLDVGQGPVVLLLHGFPTSSFLWRREAWLLAQRMRVIAPDLLGYGESEKPERADLSEPAQARYVRELVEALDVEEVAAVGHDVGGAVAQILALDTGGARVGALALVDSVAFDAWPIERMGPLQSAAPERETAGFVEDAVRRILELGIAHAERRGEELVEAYLAPWRSDPRAFFRAARALTGRAVAGRDAELAATGIPVLVLWGEDDPYLPPALAERLGDLLPGSTVALLPGCSHFVNEDAPDTVGLILYHFLRSQYLGEARADRGGEPVRVYLERPPSPMERPDE